MATEIGINERRARLKALLAIGVRLEEAAERLQVSLRTVCRDVRALKSELHAQARGLEQKKDSAVDFREDLPKRGPESRPWR